MKIDSSIPAPSTVARQCPISEVKEGEVFRTNSVFPKCKLLALSSFHPTDGIKVRVVDPSLTHTLGEEHRLEYPNRSVEVLGEPTPVLPKPLCARDIKAGWIFTFNTWGKGNIYEGALLLALNDHQLNVDFNCMVVGHTAQKTAKTIAVGKQQTVLYQGCYGELEITRVDPATGAQTSTHPAPPAPKTRKVTADELKPGDVFTWVDLEGETQRPFFFTRRDGRRVFGICSGSLAERYVLDVGTDNRFALVLYPDAVLKLGAPVTELPA